MYLAIGQFPKQSINSACLLTFVKLLNLFFLLLKQLFQIFAFIFILNF